MRASSSPPGAPLESLWALLPVVAPAGPPSSFSPPPQSPASSSSKNGSIAGPDLDSLLPCEPLRQHRVVLLLLCRVIRPEKLVDGRVGDLAEFSREGQLLPLPPSRSLFRHPLDRSVPPRSHYLSPSAIEPDPAPPAPLYEMNYRILQRGKYCRRRSPGSSF